MGRTKWDWVGFDHLSWVFDHSSRGSCHLKDEEQRALEGEKKFGNGKCELIAIFSATMATSPWRERREVWREKRKARIFGKGKCKLIANFSATMVTSLPSLSLSVSLSLSHRKYLTHNIGSASYNVCVCVIVVIWVEWADVGLWVAVCFLAKISLHRPICKTTFASLTQSQAISQSFRVFISFRSMRDTTFFSFFETLFFYKITVSFTMVIKRSPGGQASCRWRAVNFEIHLWSSGRNADCIWRSISIQHVQIEAGLNSDPGNDSFWDKIRDAEHVDRSTH